MINEPLPEARIMSVTESRATIILCGGQSTRMGFPKPWLPFGPERMLQRVARIVEEVTPHRIVVAAAGMDLPPLPPNVVIVRDEHEARGPLEGLRAGLKAAQACDAVYVTGCDVPLLVPAFITRLFAECGDHNACVPQDEKFSHPLAAVYRPSALAAVERLLAADHRRLTDLLDVIAAKRLPVSQLRDVDPELVSLRNLNQPEDYFAALAAAGLSLTERTQ